MPPRKKVEQEQTAPLYVGFFGSGEVEPTEVDALLTDYLQSVDPSNEREISFIIPITKDSWNDTVAAVCDFVTGSQLPFEAVTDKTSATGRGAVPAALKKAEKTHEVVKVGAKLMAELTKKDGDRLLAVAWPAENDDEFETVVTLALKAEIPIRDLTDSFDEPNISMGDEDEGGEAPAADAGADAPEAEPEPWSPYSEEELDGKDTDTLKLIAADFGVDIPPRSRKPTYLRLILEAQKAYLAENPDVAEQANDEGAKVEGRVTNVEAHWGGPGASEIANAVVEALFGDGGPLAGLDEDIETIYKAVSDVEEQVKAIMVNTQSLLTRAGGSDPQDEPEPEDEPPARSNVRRLPTRR